jgi:hypothetical protein
MTSFIVSLCHAAIPSVKLMSAVPLSYQGTWHNYIHNKALTESGVHLKGKPGCVGRGPEIFMSTAGKCWYNTSISRHRFFSYPFQFSIHKKTKHSPVYSTA